MNAFFKTAFAQAADGGVDVATARQLFTGAEIGLRELMAAAAHAAAMAGKQAFTCGIVNAKSGRCQENCAFCAQSAHHRTDAPVHPLLDREEMLRRAERLSCAGADYMGMVTSGTGPDARDFDNLCEIAAAVRKLFGLKLCASLGLLDREQALRLKQAGFASYHHNLETAASFYPEICSSHPYRLRVETVRAAKAAGLRTCAGGIFGIGENWEQRIELSALLRELDVDSIPANFLTAVPGTPLEHTPPLEPGEALAILAMLRLMHPGRDIVVCGGRTACLGRYDTLIFAAGANGMMIGDYLTTRGGALAADRELLDVLGRRA